MVLRKLLRLLTSRSGFTFSVYMFVPVIFSGVTFICHVDGPPTKKPAATRKTADSGILRHIPPKQRIPLHQLDAGVLKSQRSAFAEGTLANLTTQWVKYVSFCLYHHLDPFPASVETLCRYAHFLSLGFKAHESVVNYICGVKTLHVLLKLPVAAFKDLSLQFTLKGMARNNTYEHREAPPVTIPILQDIYELLDMDSEDDVIFWAVLLVGFFLLLRKCNLVPDSTAKFNPDKQIKWQDLQFKQDHVRVTLRWTKNNQFGRKPLVFALPRIPDSCLCPVTAVLAVLQLSVNNGQNCNGCDSLFKRANGSCYTYGNLQSKLKWVSKILGLDPHLTSHSLRAGGATAAFIAGVPADLIQILGHWKSDCYKRYLRLPEQARLAAGLLMKYHVQRVQEH